MKKALREPLVNRLVRYGQMIIYGVLLGRCTLTLMPFFALDSFPFRMAVLMLLLPVLMLIDRLLALVHELGHLVGGLISGRRMHFVNVAGLHLLRRPDGSFRWGYAASPGMGGSCETVTEKSPAPFVLYLLCGPLMTLIAGAVCGFFADRVDPTWYLGCAAVHVLLRMAAVQGVVDCIANLIPRRFQGGMSDGMQLLTLLRDAQARADWEAGQRISWEEYQGRTLPEMPDALFAPLPVARLTNPYAMGLAQTRLGRLMDQRDFAAALALCRELLEAGVPLAPFQLMAVVRTGAVCEAMLGSPGDLCQRMKEPAIRRMMQLTGKTIGTNLCWYVLARLVQRDKALADRHLAAFTRAAARSPFRESVGMDTAMISLVEEKAKENDCEEDA